MADKQNLAKKIDLNTKQDILIAGQNITIAADGKTISAANPTSVTVTPVYQAGTLVAAIIVNGNTTNIYAPAQHGDNANQNLAVSFSAAQTYEVGDFVIYQENLYQCITAISTPAAWDSTKWTRALITDVMGQGSGGDYANQNIANTYSTTLTYAVGDYVIYDGLLYKCIAAVETPGPFNATYWERCIVTDEMGGGGGLDLPDNWTWDEEALTAFGYAQPNEYGWGVADDTFYVDERISFTTSNRTWTRDNDYPTFLAYVNHNGWNGTISVSTNADATHFSLGSWHNNQDYGPYEYGGYNWYLSGMEYSDVYTGSTLPYLGSYSYTSEEGSFDAMCLQMITDLMTRSQLNGMTDQFLSVMQPGSGTLIAGGGEETDLSDATFKVTSNGAVYATEFYKNGVPIGGGGGSSYSETTLWSGSETPTTSGMDITLSSNISDYDLLVIYTYDSNYGYGGDNFYLVNDLAIGNTYISTVYAGNELGAYWTYTSGTSINIKRQASAYPVTYTSIKGIKFGGGGGGSSYNEDILWSGTQASAEEGVSISLSDNISDYDAIIIDCGRQSGNDYRHGYIWYPVSDLSIGSWYLQIINTNDTCTAFWNYTSNTSITWTSAYNAYPVTLFSVKGVKFGGGGNVDDVYVNGESVLDSNKIAQIKSYKEVTQAEYDALPASKESDNVLYCIKDKATADTTVAPIIYSEEEREIGVWVDGKPLYQKTYILSQDVRITNSGTYITTYIDNNTTIDSVIDGMGYYVGETVNTSASNIFVQHNNSDDSMQAWCAESGTFNRITLQYTKTTDTPGSGKYAPSGVPAVHYSENEQVVGTWVDGSTIYERTFNVEYLTSSTKSIAHGINNLGHIVQIYGYVTNNTYNFPMPYVTTDAASCIGITVDATNINIISINRNDYYGYVTIRYTKTTS